MPRRFSIAFAWVTVFYAAAHALHGVDPRDNQIGLPRGHVDGLLTLLLIYLSVCLFAGLLSVRLRLRDGDKVIVLAEACDFFPSPIFSDCLCGNPKILRCVHRRDACSMAWRCRFLAARPSQIGHVIAEK